MDKNRFNVCAASVLTTLAEVEDGWSPRSTLMLGLSMTLAEYTAFEGTLSRAGLIRVESSEIVKITADGRKLAAKIEEAVAKKAG